MSEQLTREQKALACLRKIAEMCADEKTVVFEPDFDFATATICIDDAHTHIGSMHEGGDDANFGIFIDNLYGQLVEGRGLSWHQDRGAGGGDR